MKTGEIRQEYLTGERALFQGENLEIYDSIFADGESPLKESHDIKLEGCMFKWKYPFWYAKNITARNCTWFEMARAGVWYTDHITAEDPERNFLVGRTYCCSFPGQKKEEKKQFSEGEPDVRGSFKPVRSPCLYQGISDIKR